MVQLAPVAVGLMMRKVFVVEFISRPALRRRGCGLCIRNLGLHLREDAAAAVVHNDQTIGFLGELIPEVAARFNLKQRVFVFELVVERVHALIPERIAARPIPKFPSIARDITLIVPHALAAETVCHHIRTSGETLVEDVRIFDVFMGAPIPADKKSLSIRVTYRSAESTLEDEAVNTIHQRMSEQLLEAFHAQLPT